MDRMSRGLEPCSAPSAALMMRTSLLPGERLEGAPPGLTLSPAPGTLRLWGHSAAREESVLPKDQCSYSVSFQTLTISTSDVGNTRGHIILKGQSPAFSFLEVIQEPQDLNSWFDSVMAKSVVTAIAWVVLDLLGSIYDARGPETN